jgi:hypothetical protein
MNKVVTVFPLSDGHLFIEMANGQCGEFDMKPYMGSEFFSALKNEGYFKQVKLFFRGVGWPDGQDIGPDTVAAGLKAVSQVCVG